MKVYAGVDRLSGRRHYLTETIPPGPRAAADAEKVRTRLLNQVDEHRNPRTKATVDQLMDRYLEVLDVDVTTRKTYEGYIRNHVRPLLGKLPVGKLNDETPRRPGPVRRDQRTRQAPELRITRISVLRVEAGVSLVSRVQRLAAVYDWHPGNWLEAAPRRCLSPTGSLRAR
ncbi:tyrosine-type recombinase/integrase [Pseudonocardia bannensis]|uniref:hypothetical protein n=1 Tax=Pseudonocardia bannensis TaxID=630973 RepID=UPI0028A74ABB|nr:hypothetical protein [Pseudonocardia bannensis]